MSRAWNIFNEIRSKEVAYIDDMIKNQISEELFLDYKCVATPNGGVKLSDDDKRNLGKAISGFGNSDGGVVVWGVDCRMIKGVGDVPVGYQADTPGPLKSFSPNWFKSILENFTSGTTLPSHQGVQHISLTRPEKNDGVVVTYVPAGTSVPYRSISDGKDVYYIRSGSDFRPAPHAVLAALFGQRPQPVINIFCNISPQNHEYEAPQSDHVLWVNLEVTLKNVGRGMAEDLFMLIDVTSTPFACKHHPFDIKNWQLDVDKSSSWKGPRMAVTRPLSSRLPPGGSLTFCFELVEQHPLRDFSVEITAGSPGGPSDYKQILVGHANIEEACAIYSETPREDRHRRKVMEAIAAKLSL